MWAKFSDTTIITGHWVCFSFGFVKNLFLLLKCLVKIELNVDFICSKQINKKQGFRRQLAVKDA